MKLLLGCYSYVLLLAIATHSSLGQLLPLTSSGRLLDLFTDIYEVTGTFPDDRDEYTQLSVVNRNFNSCVAILGRKVGNGGRLGLENCFFTTYDSPELFWLRHAGQGYVTLATPWNKCVGAGLRFGAAVWTGDWCDHPSHQFVLDVIGDAGVLFVHRESGSCLAAVAEKQPLRTDLCDPKDPRQLWSICVPSGKTCWPFVTPPVTSRADVVGEGVVMAETSPATGGDAIIR